MRPLPLLALAGACLALGGVAAWLVFSEPEAPAGQQRPPYVLPAVLAEVELRDVQPHVQLTGTVRAIRAASLTFEVAGVVSEVLVQDADRVTRGQVLARLDARDQALDVASRTTDLRFAQRQLDLLQAGTRAEALARIEADWNVAQANRALARLEVERGRRLREQNVISDADVDRLRAELDAASGRAESARQSLEEARAGTREEDLAIARARLDQAQALLDEARQELEKTVLRAPWDGVVTDRLVSAGSHVDMGEPVYGLVDPTFLEVEVRIPSRYAHRLGPSPDVRITVDEVPEFSLQAQLTAQVPAADELSRNFTGVARLPARPADAVLKPGMFCRLDLQLLPLRDALSVPRDAVRLTERGPIVVVADPAPPPAEPPAEGAPPPPPFVARWVPVRVLGADDRGQAVRPLEEGTLAAGQQVVVTGVDLAFPGAPLLPRPKPGEGGPGSEGSGSEGSGGEGGAE